VTEEWYGLHERLSTPALMEALEEAGIQPKATEWSKKLSLDDLAPELAAHLGRVFAELTGALRDKDSGAWQDALERLGAALNASNHPFRDLPRQLPSFPPKRLQGVRRPKALQVGEASPVRPDLPLAVSALLTGSSRTPSLASQLEKEMASADRVDWLVSFIKWSGIRPLRDALRRFVEVDVRPGAGPRLRIATTSYLGATDLKAVKFLAELPNTEVRVSYDTHRTRLHAKAFLFHRGTGFGSAYVGSANVSRAALDEGLEWTAKISQHELPYLWRQIQAAFESHWEDPREFEPVKAGSLERLAAALSAERSGGVGNEGSGGVLPFFDLRPYPFQQEILESIDAERRAGIQRHLVIAATGTGKTMVAAFDYHRFFEAQASAARESGAPTPPHPSLLFLAHREEILRQSLQTFRQVLRNHEFGDLLVGGSVPRSNRHLFASVQSWHSRELDQLPPDHFDYVVLDEAHHAAANSYQAILGHLKPRVLLGLTATPERADGRDIRTDFRPDGGDLPPFTHELRLADAIDRTLLAPFHYFGIQDAAGVDLSNLTWRPGGYDQRELENVLGANDARARWVRDQFQEWVADPLSARALGFCVSQAHAHFMARRFTEWGIPSAALTAESPRDERRQVQGDLVARRIRVLFTVDLYNEGVDIPEVDTVLLLRPTESLTVYLQQIGRGLRLHAEKPHLTVLDFIAPQHRQFRFAERFRALSRNIEERIDRQIEAGFPWLPSGCLIKLDRVATERVLANIRETVGMHRPRVVRELVQLRQRVPGRPTLRQMMNHLHLDLDRMDDLLRHGLPCRLLEQAGGETCLQVEPHETALARGLRAVAACDDRQLLEILRHSLRIPVPDQSSTDGLLKNLSSEDRLRLELAHSLLWGKARPGDGRIAAAHQFVVAVEGLRQDLLEVVEERLLQIRPASGRFFGSASSVLELHAHYTREQVLLALGKGTFDAPMSHREGVLHVEERKVDAFFVTVRKGADRFSPTTMYEDYALSDELFHWQSQSTTAESSPTGRRYIRHRELGYTPLLFVREASELDNRLTAPFVYLGPLQYIRHEGSRPMSITWRMVHPMPARVVRWSRGAA
jgi:superfamily II DNA or RNA helicase/HKD family nuclease